MPPNKKSSLTYDQQCRQNRYDSESGFRSAQSLGLPTAPLATTQPRQAVISRIDSIEPHQTHPMQSGGQVLKTSHRDRTDAYIRRMRPLTLLGGVAIGFGFVALEVVPIISLGFVALVLISCLACLMVGEIVYQLVSPDGIGIFSELLRHRRLQSELDYIYGDQTKDKG